MVIPNHNLGKTSLKKPLNFYQKLANSWFANSMDLTSLTSSVINIPLSRQVHNHSIGCTAINSIGTTNTSIRLLVRCMSIK